MSGRSVIDVTQEPELRWLAEQAQTTRQPAALMRDREVLAVVTPVGRPAADAPEGYDPERARAVLEASASALHGVDQEQLLADIHAQRGQKSRRS
jgi:hypothetical protein